MGVSLGSRRRSTPSLASLNVALSHVKEDAAGQSLARTHPNVTLAVLAIGGVAYAMLSSMVVPALPTIQRDLHASETGITWLLTAYLLSASVSTSILGRLGDMYGKERLL